MMDNEKMILIANGTGEEIFDAIKNEIQSLDTVLNELSMPVESLRPEVQFAYKRMKGYPQSVEKFTVSMMTYRRRVLQIEQNSGIQQIRRLEEELKQSSSPQHTVRIRRELSHQKSINARKLSDLVSNQQRLLQERLQIVNIWISVLNLEIYILEEGKQTIIEKIVLAANQSGDSSVIEMVRERLRNMPVKDTLIDKLKFDPSSVSVSNIHVLHQTLEKQLDDVQRTELIVSEKKQVVTVLNGIAKDIRHFLPEKPSPTEPVISMVNQTVPMNLPSTPDSSEPSSEKPARMAFQKKEQS